MQAFSFSGVNGHEVDMEALTFGPEDGYLYVGDEYNYIYKMTYLYLMHNKCYLTVTSVTSFIVIILILLNLFIYKKNPVMNNYSFLSSECPNKFKCKKLQLGFD